ncbi:hypothetical protein K488DRAFT_46527 [Vararia minispora EC-137]|uniref:Uncharacterized protein n=1 Tax=Vararia minispora EC-137 TaxID=1314806 RepID=A0ACB8QQ29_9AGAM|nr:hypothetical protein K488DRAFT_46527 [Vararia minispora EC-137]
MTAQPTTTSRTPKPPPTGPAPPAPKPSSAPANGAPANGVLTKGKKKTEPTPVDPAAMYESLKNRIAALEEEEEQEEEEERRYAEEAQKSVKDLEENAVHAKYIELFAELKRLERDHQKAKQKLTKDKDAAKSQLTKANQGKVKMENLARELQKENKKLREDSRRMAQSVQEAQGEILQLKNDISKRIEKARAQEAKFREKPDIMVKIVCRYRAELFFKISRKTKLSKLFNTWTDRMDAKNMPNGIANVGPVPIPSSQFVFTHSGRMLDAELTPEEAGIEDVDEILAIELMDLTEEPRPLVQDSLKREKLKKEWIDDPAEAHRSLEDIFDCVVRERLKEVLRQYELRERHFECVVRSKELEVLLSRARAEEQKQLAEGDRLRASRLEEENRLIRQELDDAQKGQAMLVDRLIACCKESTSERAQKLFATLGEELEKRRAAKIGLSGSLSPAPSPLPLTPATPAVAG